MKPYKERQPTGPEVSGERPTGSPTEPLAEDEAPLDDAGLRRLPVVERAHYAVEAEIARGGHGRVLHARDLRLGRAVAIKELLRESHEQVARFVREAVITARLQHPGIVPVHEAGRWPSGELFYAMKRVSGEPLDRRIEAAGSFEARLALLPHAVAATDAIAYAHARGVIHRDLKPANIVVGEFGETVVVDWGIAKRVGEAEAPLSTEEGTSGEHTRLGMVIGTPAYMPPEQAAAKEVDRRADVYALGATLYHVLAGAAPFHDAGHGVLDGPPTPLRDLAPHAQDELVAIVEKAMARDPEQRYPSAKELADDLKRFLAGQLVAAHRYSSWELARRWMKRNRVLFGSSTLFAVLLAVVGVASFRKIVVERNVARAQEKAAEEANAGLVAANDALRIQHARAELDRDPTAAIAWLKSYPAHGTDWRAAGAIAQDAWTRGVARHVFRAEEPLHALVFSPDGKRVAAVGSRVLALYDVESGRAPTRRAEDGLGAGVVFAAGSVWTSGGHVLLRWDLEGGAPVRYDLTRDAGELSASADGRFVLAADAMHGRVTLWDVAGARQVPLPEEATTACFVGKNLALATTTKLVLVSLETQAALHTTPIDQPRAQLRASADGAYIALGLIDGVDVFDGAGTRVRSLRADRFLPSAYGVSIDGTGKVLVCSREAQFWSWDLKSNASRVLAGSCTRIRANEQYAAGAGITSEVQIWDIAGGGGLKRLLGHSAKIHDATVSPDGRWVASASEDGTLRVFRLGEGDVRVYPGVNTPHGLGGGRYLLTMATGTHVLSLVDIETGESRRISDARPASWGSATWIRKDGRLVVYSDDTQQIWRWSADDGVARPWFRYTSPGARNLTQDISSDGKLFVGGTSDYAVVVVDLETKAKRELGRHTTSVSSVRFSSDGRRVVSSADRVVRIWDVATGASRALEGHTDDVWDAAFSPDDTRVASSSVDGTTRIWDAATGATLLVLRGHGGSVSSASWSADGTRILTAGDDATIRLWDTRTGDGDVIRRDVSLLWNSDFSSGSRYVVSTGSAARGWVWDPDATPALVRDPTTIAKWLDAITTARVDDHGNVASP